MFEVAFISICFMFSRNTMLYKITFGFVWKLSWTRPPLIRVYCIPQFFWTVNVSILLVFSYSINQPKKTYAEMRVASSNLLCQSRRFLWSSLHPCSSYSEALSTEFIDSFQPRKLHVPHWPPPVRVIPIGQGRPLVRVWVDGLCK